ncbi:hypothetical protein BDV25DRAFT_163114 [Aspergillus avenaceus]|uniref:Serine/threonine-protein kinase ppk6 n=1 Tax=Aspergillus avenaceus TaxID=36643 RepID=A0A5N6TIC0_ASPAV|nr:hypothetical protein BDV25DRAFT_163114 [Aspergillus avenaceus]
MSADLFAEFGFGTSSNRSQQQQQLRVARPSGTASLIPDLEPTDNNHHFFSTDATPRVFPSHQNTIGKSLPVHSKNDSDILFDATLETPPDDESDDWGEFESADVPPSQSIPPNTIPTTRTINHQNRSNKSTTSTDPLDLFESLSVKDNIPPTPSQNTTTLVNDTPGPRNQHIASSATAITEQEDVFDEWGDFVDGPPIDTHSIGGQASSHQKKPINNRKANTKPEAKDSSSFKMSGNVVSPAQVRPTNIPPPAVLLELFPRLFEQLREETAEAKKNVHDKQKVEDVSSLILCTLKSAARVIAGRTLRWKRDTILSQSMRIGPARAGKSGGMKLNTVNKNEDIKEQQEAVDVISTWRDRTALFNSIVQASGKRPVHVVPPTIRVITATPAQGALKASHACALCGLKRDERLPKVDDQVEDSFGEWWTDHWGHTDCRQFWETNVNLLGQR